jgi:hypothetical protein
MSNTPTLGFRRAYKWTAETIPDDAEEIPSSISTYGQRLDILIFSDSDQCKRAFDHLCGRNFPCAMDIAGRKITVVLPDIIP